MKLINKKVIQALFIFSVSFSVHMPLISVQENASKLQFMGAKSAPIIEPTKQELQEMQILLKEKIGEAIELSNEIQAQQKAGLPAVIIDIIIDTFLDLIRTIMFIYLIIYGLVEALFRFPLFLTIFRSLTKDIKEGTPEAIIKEKFFETGLYNILPLISSGTLSPNIFNISLAYTDHQEQVLAELKKPGALSTIQKGLRGALFMLNRVGTYAKVSLKLVATIIVLAFITLMSAISVIFYIPVTIFSQLFKALTFLREKVAIEPSVPEIDPIGS